MLIVLAIAVSIGLSIEKVKSSESTSGDQSAQAVANNRVNLKDLNI